MSAFVKKWFEYSVLAGVPSGAGLGLVYSAHTSAKNTNYVDPFFCVTGTIVGAAAGLIVAMSAPVSIPAIIVSSYVLYKQ
jgi:uncharacterized membrane-anchored protein YitT (DUF2179 family)